MDAILDTIPLELMYTFAAVGAGGLLLLVAYLINTWRR
jgi:hypothetical protein